MANPEHLEKLLQGADAWNSWRQKNLVEEPDLSGAVLDGADLAEVDLGGADLSEASLRGANLFRADLMTADLIEANLRGANLNRADLGGAACNGTNFSRADLRGASLYGAWLEGAYLIRADLRGANLIRVNLWGANLKMANLEGATMRYACLVNADLRGATLSGCRVYGASAWDLRMNDKTKQESLVITPGEEQEITVDDLEIAQFLYLVLNNEKLGHFIRVMRTKAVLILGSFRTSDSTDFLDGLRLDLSARGFVPIIFNFDTSSSSFRMQTVRTLALLSNFVIVDLSDRSGQYKELEIVSTTYVPFILIAKKGTEVSGMLVEPQDWMTKEFFPYPVDKEEAKNYIPGLVEKDILPSAIEINEDLKKDRERPNIPEAKEKYPDH